MQLLPGKSLGSIHKLLRMALSNSHSQMALSILDTAWPKQHCILESFIGVPELTDYRDYSTCAQKTRTKPPVRDRITSPGIKVHTWGNLCMARFKQ